MSAGVLWLAGCADNERFTYATEADEPNYREGVALLKTGRKQEALTAFLKVIEKRANDSAESHLEVGLLYLQHINDPLSAIYHFKKFLALRPNSQQANLVRQRIDAATRDFARTLPAQPLENQLQRVDLVATLDRLKQENESLKQELADLKANRDIATVATQRSDLATTRTAAPVEPVAEIVEEPVAAPASGLEASEDFNFSLNTLPTVRTRRASANATNAAVRPPPALTPAPRPSPAASAQKQPTVTTPPQKNAAASTAAPAGGRQHVVRPGETLSQISLQYYGNRSRWRDIYAANRSVMRSESDLKVGMAIRIP